MFPPSDNRLGLTSHASITSDNSRSLMDRLSCTPPVAHTGVNLPSFTAFHRFPLHLLEPPRHRSGTCLPLMKSIDSSIQQDACSTWPSWIEFLDEIASRSILRNESKHALSKSQYSASAFIQYRLCLLHVLLLDSPAIVRIFSTVRIERMSPEGKRHRK